MNLLKCLFFRGFMCVYLINYQNTQGKKRNYKLRGIRISLAGDMEGIKFFPWNTRNLELH